MPVLSALNEAASLLGIITEPWVQHQSQARDLHSFPPAGLQNRHSVETIMFNNSYSCTGRGDGQEEKASRLSTIPLEKSVSPVLQRPELWQTFAPHPQPRAHYPNGETCGVIIITSPDTWKIRTWRQQLVLLCVAAGFKRLEGSDISVLRAKLSTNDNFSTKRREGSDERDGSIRLPLISLDLNCFFRPSR